MSHPQSSSITPIGSHLRRRYTLEDVKDDPRYQNIDFSKERLGKDTQEDASQEAWGPKGWVCRNFIVKKPQPSIRHLLAL